MWAGAAVEPEASGCAECAVACGCVGVGAWHCVWGTILSGVARDAGLVWKCAVFVGGFMCVGGAFGGDGRARGMWANGVGGVDWGVADVLVRGVFCDGDGVWESA